ncbi:MAG: hypothetical protein ACE5I1_28885, partial [bacterium]
MKLNLENFEEKFYFRTSHLFWHLLTGIAGLALVIGVLILLWGITPSLKPSVKKTVYPEPVAVTADEVLLRIAPPAKKVEIAGKTPQVYPTSTGGEVKPQPAAQVDSTELAYQSSMDSLKVLLPPKKFPWKSHGHWEKEWYNRRKWVVDVWGINDRLKSAFKKVNAQSFVDKQKLLDAYIALVSPFPEKQRYKVFKAAISYTKDDVWSAVRNTELLSAAIPHFDTEKADFIETLAKFGRKNPRDGSAFIAYMNATIPQFETEYRREMLKEFVKCYYDYFDNIGKQKEATGMFLPMLSNFESKQQAKALNEFYQLYLAKNANREREIANIDYTYEQELQSAEYVLAQKRTSKTGYRTLGLQVFGGSVIFIAFIALFLVLLSIQRNIKQMREATA